MLDGPRTYPENRLPGAATARHRHSATVGCVCLAAALHGWLRGALNHWQRAVLGIAALLLIKPGVATDAIGFGLLGLVLVLQFLAQPARTTTKVVP